MMQNLLDMSIPPRNDSPALTLIPPVVERRNKNTKELISPYFARWVTRFEKLLDENYFSIFPFINKLHAAFYQHQTLRNSKLRRFKLLMHLVTTLELLDIGEKLSSEVEYEEESSLIE